MQKTHSSALNNPNHFITLQSVSNSAIEGLLSRAREIKETNWKCVERSNEKKRATVALFFFEASTRTALSFEIAAQKLGHNILQLPQVSSLSKGETQIDTLLNVRAMGVDLMVVRAGDELPFDQIPIQCSLINAGWGRKEHPTQALLDLMTLEELQLKRKNILIVGDIEHSRVFGSLSPILQRFHYNLKSVSTLSGNLERLMDEDLEWADVVYLLRVQKERHQHPISLSNYHEQFGFTRERLERHEHLQVMHPGPINYGVEVFDKILQHPRSQILQQVENGVFVRAALIEAMLGGQFL